MKRESRGEWSSQFGFVLSTAGSAVGLANIWAFPFRTGQNGGAAFVIVYLACIILVCLPFMIGELAIGRHSQKSAVGAIRAISPAPVWRLLGALCISAGVFILSFYSVVAGWSFGYIFKLLLGGKTSFSEFTASPWTTIPLLLCFLLLTVLVVHKGIQGGIERWSRLLMPTLIFLMLLLIGYGLTLPGAGEGLAFFLKPDFSKLTSSAVMTALGQAFFSLSLGIGGILTYGSYLRKDEDIVTASKYVALLDTGIAILAGLMIFPALFSFGQQPSEGPALVFIVLPKIFAQLPGGNIVGALFFVMLTIAALTSTISILEIPVAYAIDEKGWPRKKIVWLVGLGIFFLALPSALSQGAVAGLSSLSFFGGKSFLELMIFLWFDVFPPLGALLFSILIGWVWGVDEAAGEVSRGHAKFGQPLFGTGISMAHIWGFFLRYICPLAIILIWFGALTT